MMVFEDLEAILPQVAQWKSLGEKIVFTNGVFDILHIGHVHYLEEARKEGDRLIVGLNDDASVRRLNKGPERPINPQDARAGVLAALRCVDAVVIFGEDTPPSNQVYS
jgi:D-glycero-beta-D-manno-heptose 1-phosphate adenylyltransferase